MDDVTKDPWYGQGQTYVWFYANMHELAKLMHDDVCVCKGSDKDCKSKYNPLIGDLKKWIQDRQI